MTRDRLFWKLFLSYLLVTLGLLLPVAWYGLATVHDFYFTQLRIDLESHGRLLSERLAPLIDRQAWAEAGPIVERLGRETGIRVSVILADGRVIADSERDPSTMDNHLTRPEVAAALKSGQAVPALRDSPTMDTPFLYVAVPIARGGREVAVVRTAKPLAVVEAPLRQVQRQLLLAMLVVAGLILVLSAVVAGRISRPLVEMTRAAEQFAQGQLDQRIRVEGSREVRQLAAALNEMAAQLHQRIETISRQRNHQEAVLASMVEGVLALDNDGRILGLNEAAGHMLDIVPASAPGRYVYEAIRKPELIGLVNRLLAGAEPLAEDIVLRGVSDRSFTVHGTALQDAQSRAIGVLVVLHDVTRLRRLEQVRSDFVANVSHELCTPLTSIKGYAEALIESALDDRELAERFARTILRQADRLSAVVADLFTLAEVERDARERAVPLERRPLRDVLQAAIAQCQYLSEKRRISVALECPEDLQAALNARLFEQAVVNLVDNAVKYSPEESAVRVVARAEPDGTVVEVIDQGPGIESKHLPRLFERFYRVDKARSRSLGGTGLGLAIVRHIVLAHGGTVSVDSRVGHGSTFRIRLPGGQPAPPTEE